MSKRTRDAAAAIDDSSKRSRRGDTYRNAEEAAGVAQPKRRGRAANPVPAVDSTAADTAAASSALAAPAAEPAAAAAADADADAEYLDPRLSACVPFDGYTHLLQAYEGPHALCVILDRPPELALDEDALQTSEDPHRPKSLAPIVLRFVDRYLHECGPPADFFSRPTAHTSSDARRRKQLNAVQHCIHAILFNAPLSFEQPVAFHDVIVYPVRRELPTATTADGTGGPDFNLIYTNLAEELGATFLETHAIVPDAAAATVASKKKKGSSRSAASSASSLPLRRVGVYYQFFVQIRPADSVDASAAQEERMDLAVAPASPPPTRRQRRKDQSAAAATSHGRSRSRAPRNRSSRATREAADLPTARELDSTDAPVDLSALASVVAIGPRQPRSQAAQKIYPLEKPPLVLKKVVLRKKKVKTDE